jgi:hypothetical protein
MKPLIEPLECGNPAEVFADDLAAVTQLGSVTHLLFSARQPDPYDRRIHRVLQLRLIVPTEQIKRIGLIIARGQLEMQQTGDTEADAVVVH